MYVYISMLAYFVILLLTLRDIRIFRRTGIDSYRKGALKGIAASTVTLFGVLITPGNPEPGLFIVFIGLFINRKGVREKVFNEAGTIDRLFGKTDV
ncbi:MAG: hypothetical protein JW705_04235 [Methanosarcinaceae archaeon]|nr:hypothetical protein [Methanosarcinaceae archaeon]